MRKYFVVLAALAALCFLTGCGSAGNGSDELQNEGIAITFHKEVTRGGYKVLSVAELKKWLDDKKEILIIDTTPKDVSYDKNHIPGAVQIQFPIPEMTEMSDEQKAAFEKVLGVDAKDVVHTPILLETGFTKTSLIQGAACEQLPQECPNHGF